MFEKGISKKKCARFFRIYKYAFFNTSKRNKKETVPGILRFVSMLFLIFKKEDKQKTLPGILRFLSILFLIFEKGIS